MLIRLGNIVVRVHLPKNLARKSLSDYTLADLAQAQFSFFIDSEMTDGAHRSGKTASPQASKDDLDDIFPDEEPPPPAPVFDNLTMLKKAGFTSQIIAMIANRLFGMQTKGEGIVHVFEKIQAKSEEWLERPLTEKFWGLFIGKIAVTDDTTGIAVIGLNSKNHLSVLAIHPNENATEMFHRLRKRGLKKSDVRVVVLGLAPDLEKVVMEELDSAEIARDWQSVTKIVPARSREHIKRMMVSPSYKEAVELYRQLVKEDAESARVLKPHIKNLFSYYNYDKKLWRVLRTLNPVARFETDLKHRINKVNNQAERHLLLNWVALRLTYQWSRLSVDSEAISNLRWVKVQVEPIN